MSDRTGKKPPGTLILPSADWFSDHLYCAGYELTSPSPFPESYATIALFNNDQSGRLLKVYGATVSADAGQGFGFYWTQTPVGAEDGVVNSIRPDRPVEAGQIFEQHQNVALGAPNPYYNFPATYLLGTDGYDQATIISPFPLFIIPVGWALVGTNQLASVSLGLYLWYQVSARQ